MTGTRGGLGRIVAMVIGLVALAFLLLAGTARAGTYEVAQCGWGVGAELDPAAAKTAGDAAYLHPGWCTAPPAGTPAGMAFELGLAPYSDQGIAQARWVAPPGTNFAGARFTWSGELQDGTEQIAGVDDRGEFRILASAFLSNAPGVVAVGVTGPAPAFEVRLKCLLLGAWPVGCTRSARSTLRLSALTLAVDDPTPPAAKLGGPLLAAGWHRETDTLESPPKTRSEAGSPARKWLSTGRRSPAQPWPAPSSRSKAWCAGPACARARRRRRGPSKSTRRSSPTANTPSAAARSTSAAARAAPPKPGSGSTTRPRRSTSPRRRNARWRPG